MGLVNAIQGPLFYRRGFALQVGVECYVHVNATIQKVVNAALTNPTAQYREQQPSSGLLILYIKAVHRAVWFKGSILSHLRMIGVSRALGGKLTKKAAEPY